MVKRNRCVLIQAVQEERLARNAIRKNDIPVIAEAKVTEFRVLVCELGICIGKPLGNGRCRRLSSPQKVHASSHFAQS